MLTKPKRKNDHIGPKYTTDKLLREFALHCDFSHTSHSDRLQYQIYEIGISQTQPISFKIVAPVGYHVWAFVSRHACRDYH